MQVVFTAKAEEEFNLYRAHGELKLLKKIFKILEELERTPFTGQGKPERLRHELEGYWSRRINREHRIVYRIEEDKVIIIQMRYHY